MDRVDQMYEAVRTKIMNLEVDPTQPINEQALVRETGGTITLVQQALAQLGEEGTVVQQRGRWYVAQAATAAIMREIFEVRTTLEGMCARLAAEHITPEQLEKMEQVHRDFERVIKEGDNKALITVDQKFHRLIYEASGNRFLARALDEMYTLVYRLFYLSLDRMGSVRANVEDHRAILDAIESGDGRLAERLIQLHITHFRTMVEELL
jgi:DNA-binding GntR family transcriptional regulator